jgi:hypothetical protein
MLGALPQDASDKYLQGGLEASYRRFQNANGLPVSGTGDETTRKALIAEYMAQDKTSLPDSAEVTTHGCGEHFPEFEPGENEDNRRVEIFVFDGPIVPPPQGELSGPGATDYPAWLALTIRSFDFSTGTTTVVTGSIRLELAAADAVDDTDKLVLRTADGYEQNHVIAADHVAADDSGQVVDVEFTEAPVDGVFTLTIVPSEGEEYEVFAGVPFATLGVLGLVPTNDNDGSATDGSLPLAAIAGMDQPADSAVA